jgi:protein-S-isoprenylcysteine O-methyltransferase Ste14
VAETESTFRLVLGVLIALGLGLRFYYQSRHRDVVRTAVRHGRRDTLYYYLTLSSYVLVLGYVLSDRLDFAHLDVPTAVRWIGVPLGVGALWLFAACHQALGRYWSGILELSADHALITKGPYRYIRHPMYTSLLASSLAISLVSANWLVALACIGSATSMYLARVRDEESMMLDQFGESYRQYMDLSGRLLPKLGSRGRTEDSA